MLKHALFVIILLGHMFALNYDEAFEKLRVSFKKNLETFRADITQEVKIADISQTQILSGKITVKKPDKLLLEYSAPVKQSIISDGKTFWIYLQEQNQVIVQASAAVKSKNNIIFQLPRYIEYLKKKYIGSLKEEEPHDGVEAVLLEFVPKGGVEEQDFAKIVLWVDKEKWLPLSSTVYIDRENSITVKFSNIKTAEKLEDSMFEFKIPEGTEKITSLLE